MAEPASPRVLVVHRDPDLRARIAAVLTARGHAVSTAPRVDVPLGRAEVIVSDHRTLPAATRAHLLVLVPDQDEATILAAFAAGADDVMAGPLRTAELASRVAVLARGIAAPHLLRVGAIAIDPTARRVSLAGQPLDLTRREYELLCQLAAAPGRVFTKTELLRGVSVAPAGAPSRRLDTQVARLRRRLGPHRTLLVTVWGVGYRLGG